MSGFIGGLPKAELHLHIEGTLEPEMMFAIAARNGVALGYPSVEALRAAYRFDDLQGFLHLYYQGMAVLLEEQDFYDLTLAYIERVHGEAVLHAEIFFDPQAHTDRGVPFARVIGGIGRALDDAEIRFGVTSRLIMCFLRDRDTASAEATLDQALDWMRDHGDRIVGVGLDSAEIGHPPGKFEAVFARARDAGLLAVAHAGEEGPAAYVREALDRLRVSRIDHGNRALDDAALVDRLVGARIPLTVCPLSNLKLRVIDDMRHHPLKEMLARGLFVTLNSDDPAYFGGYINDNYRAVRDALGLDRATLAALARNSFAASFAAADHKQRMIARLDSYLATAAV